MAIDLSKLSEQASAITANKNQGKAQVAKSKQATLRAAQKILADPKASDEQRKQALKITNPEKPGFLKSALGSAVNSPVGKGIMGLLDAFDSGRAAAVSALSESSDLFTDMFNLKGHEYVDASFKEFVKGFRDNVGMGSVFREKAAAAAAAGKDSVFGVDIFKNDKEILKDAPKGSKAFKEFLSSERGKELKYTKGGRALGITTGLVGDIGLDPLTYVTMGGTKLAGISAQGVAAKAMDAGELAIAQKAATKGKWALNADELAKIGLAGEGGFHLRAPGSGVFGRAVGLADKEVRVALGGADIMKYTPVGRYQAVRGVMRAEIANRNVSELFGGRFNTVKDAMYKGTPEDFAIAFNAVMADRVALGKQKAFATDVERRFAALEEQAHHLGIDGRDIYRALSDPDGIAEETKRILSIAPAKVKVNGEDVLLTGEQYLNSFKQFAQEYFPAMANEYGGAIQGMDELIPRLRANWQPSRRPQETRKWLLELFGERRGRGSKLPLDSTQIKAELIDGGEFMGETLYAATNENENLIRQLYGLKKADSILDERQQAQRILERNMAVYGEDSVLAMFDDDVFTAMPASIRHTSDRVRRRAMEIELINRGVATHNVRFISDPTALAAAAAQTQVRRKLSDLRLKLKIAEKLKLDASEAQHSFDRSARVLKQASTSATNRRARTIPKLAAESAVLRKEQLQLADEALTAVGRLEGLLGDLKIGEDVARNTMNDILARFGPDYAAIEAAQDQAKEGLDRAATAVGRLAKRRENLLRQAEKLGADHRVAVEAQIEALEELIGETHGYTLRQIQRNFPDIEGTVERSAREVKMMLHGRTHVEDIIEIRTALRGSGDIGTHTYERAADQYDKLLEHQKWIKDNFGEVVAAQVSTDEGADKLLNSFRAQIKKSNEQLALHKDILRLKNLYDVVPDLGAQRQRLVRLTAEAEAIGDRESVQRLLKLQQSMPEVLGAALVNPLDAEGMWHLASNTNVNLSTREGWKSVLQGSESSLGLKLTSTAGSQSDGAARVVIKASNPKTYGVDDLFDLAYSHRQFSAYGTTAPNAVRLMRNDMLRHAIDSGIFKRETVNAFFPQREAKKWGKVFTLLAGDGADKPGISLEAALNKVFGGEQALLLGRTYDVQGISDGEWILSRIADDLLGETGRMPAVMQDNLTKSFRETMSSQYDAIVLPSTLADGEWQVIALRPEVVFTANGELAEGLTTLEAAANALRHELNQQSDKLHQAADAMGVDLDTMLLNYEQHGRMKADNYARLQELQEQATLATQDSVKQLSEAQVWEVELRGAIDDLFDKASMHFDNADKIERNLAVTSDVMVRATLNEQLAIEQMFANAARMEAVAKKAEADAVRYSKQINQTRRALERHSGRVAKIFEQNIRDTGSPYLKKWSDPLTDEMKYRSKQLTKDVYAPNYLANAIADMEKIYGHPDGMGKLLSAYDRVTNVWKAQAMARPGFHIRNYMGGVINNWIGGVDDAAYGAFNKRFKVYSEVIKKGGTHTDGLGAVSVKFGVDDATKLDGIIRLGVTTGGQSTETRLIGGMHASNWNPLSTNFKAYKKSGQWMESVENRLRGAMAWDRLSKGYTMDGVLADIARYHFDYDDLSRFERAFVRRVVPFYTWTRMNFPLQVEMMLENPKHMLRFMNIKRDIEITTQDEEVYPSWFNNELNIRLPFGQGGGNFTWMVDAPFNDLSSSTSPSKYLEQMNPFIKAPLEIKGGSKYFGNIPFREGYQDAPSIWSEVGLTKFLSTIGKARKDADGEWVMRDQDIYLVEQWLPILGQARRLLPAGSVGTAKMVAGGGASAPSTEDKFNDRVLMSWAAFAFGQSSQVNNYTAQSNEWKRRNQQLRSLAQDVESLGGK